MLLSNVKFIMFNNLNDEIKIKLFKKITLYYYLQVKIEDHFCLDYQTVTTNYFNKYKDGNSSKRVYDFFKNLN